MAFMKICRTKRHASTTVVRNSEYYHLEAVEFFRPGHCFRRRFAVLMGPPHFLEITWILPRAGHYDSQKICASARQPVMGCVPRYFVPIDFETNRDELVIRYTLAAHVFVPRERSVPRKS
jgi:hypothetical protein